MKDKLSLDKVKKWTSFSKLLHNDKLMMIASLLMALLIWISVVSGPANMTERTITMDVSVELTTGGFAYQSGLRMVGNTDFVAKVHVSGPWSVLMKLDETDLRVKADTTAITLAGDFELPLVVSRNSAVADYDILSVTPSTVTVSCDYWREGVVFAVEPDVSALTVADPVNSKVGTPVLDKTSFPNGIVTLDGPKTVIDQVDRVVARVSDTKPLSAIRQYEVPLIALDENGNEVDLSGCTFREIESGKVRVTVPFWQKRTLDISYEVANAPSGINPKDYLITEPSSIEVYGTAAELDTLQEQLSDLGTIDFSKLSPTHDTVTLTLPSSIENMEVVGGVPIVTVRLQPDGLSSKDLVVMPSRENVSLSGNVNGYAVSLSSATEKPITLVGKTDSIEAITAENIKFRVTLDAAATKGKHDYTALIKIEGYNDVWAYYGDTVDGVSLSLTLQ